jgi:hypothetical protein
MRNAGLSDTEIERLQEVTIANGPQPVSTVNTSLLSRIALVSAATAAMDDLRLAVEARTTYSGQQVQDVPSVDLARLDAARIALESTISARGLQRKTYNLAAEYIADVRNVIDQTNNYRDLMEHLNDGYVALLRLSERPANPTGLADEIDRFVTIGQMSASAAAPLLQAIDDANSALMAGDFRQSAAVLASFDQLVKDAWGSTVPADIGANLLHHAKSIHDMLVFGSLQSPIQSADDTVGTIGSEPIHVDVMANDTHPDGDRISLLSVSPPRHGTVTIDDAGTPSDTADDRVVYTPGPTYRGIDSFTYYVSGDGVVGVAAGQVTVRQQLAFDQPYTRLIPLNETDTFTFDASAGSWYRLETLQSLNGVNVTVTGPDGTRVATGSAYPGDAVLFQAMLPGRHEVAFFNELWSWDQSLAEEVTFRLAEVTGLSEITHGQVVLGTLDPPANAEGVVETPYWLAVSAGEPMHLAMSPNTVGVTIELYAPDGRSMATATSSRRDLVTVPATSGEYLLVARGLPTTEPTSYEFTITTPRILRQSIAIGDTVLEEVRELGEQHVYTFDGTAGQLVLFDYDASGQSSLTLRRPDGQGIETSGMMTLPADGPYEIEIQPVQDRFEYRLNLLEVTSTPLAQTGELVSGTLEQPFEWADPDAAFYRLALTEGQTLALDPSDTAEIEYSQSSWTLYGPDAEPVAGDVIGRALLVTAPTSGDYIFEVMAASPTPFAFRFVANDPLQRDLNLDETVDGEIDVPGRVVQYNFTGVAGQVLYYESTDRDFDQIVTRLSDPDGQLVRFANADLDGIIVLPVDGEYQMQFTAQDTLLGDFGFRLSAVSNPMLLSIGETVSGEVNEVRSSVIYAIEGLNGQRLLFDNLAASEPDGGSWTLYAPDGWPLVYDFFGSDLVATLPTAGQYLLVLDRLSADPVSYGFSLIEPQTLNLSLTLGEAAIGELTEPGERHTYTFNGTAGHVLYYDSLDTSQQGTVAKLFAPDGSLVLEVISNADGPPFQLPADGKYSVRITGQGLGMSGYSFRLIDLTDQAAVPVGEPLLGRLELLDANGGLDGDGVFLLSVPGPREWILDFSPFTNPDDTVWWSIYDVGSGTLMQSSFGLTGSTALTLPRAGNYVLAFENPGVSLDFEFQLLGPTNNPPQIGEIADQTVLAGLTAVVGLDLYDEETPIAELTILVTSSDSTLIPETGLVIEDHSSFWTLSITPAAEESGAATITVMVTDESGGTASETFVLTVTPAISPTPWQNARNHFDVNDDDAVVPLDVLIVVNKLNRDGPGELPAITEPPEYYYDVSGDNFVSPLDALQIINHLNGVLAMGEGDSNTILPSNLAAGPAIDPAIAARSAWWNVTDLDDVSDDRFNRPSEIADRPELYGNFTSDSYVSPLKSRQTINDRNTRKLAGASLERMPDYPGLLGALSTESVDRVLADEQLWHLLWPDEDETDSLL